MRTPALGPSHVATDGARRRWRLTVGLLLLSGCGRMGPEFTPFAPPPLAALYASVRATPSADGFARIGRAEALRRNWLAAVEAYEQARRLDPKHAGALMELAALRIGHGEVDAALALVQQLETVAPNDAAVQAGIGDLYARLGRNELARASYRRALTLDPAQPVALLRLGMAAAGAGKLAEARDYLARLRRVVPDADETHGLELVIAQTAGDQAGIERLLREAWRRSRAPQTGSALTSYLLTQRRYAAALAVAEEWLAARPDDLDATIAKAVALSELERGAEARKLLRKAIEGHPDEARLRLAYGRILYEQRLGDQAEVELNRAVELAPLDSLLQLRVADDFARFDNPRRAEELYNLVARNDPRLAAEVALRRGLLYQQMGVKVEEGAPDPIEANYLLALRADPSDYLALNNLAFHYAEGNRRLDAARALIDRAVALRPDDANIQDTLAWVAVRAKDYATAASASQKALEGRPNDPLVHYHRAVLLEATGDRRGALAAARRALALGAEFVGRDDCAQLAARLEGKR